jgi:hypothetical protein
LLEDLLKSLGVQDAAAPRADGLAAAAGKQSRRRRDRRAWRGSSSSGGGTNGERCQGPHGGGGSSQGGGGLGRAGALGVQPSATAVVSVAVVREHESRGSVRCGHEVGAQEWAAVLGARQPHEHRRRVVATAA